MSPTDPGASVAVESRAEGPGFFANLFGLYFEPKAAFTAIVQRPAVWLPLALFMVLQVVFMAVWMSHLDVFEFLRAQAEMARKPFQAPPASALGAIRGFFWVLGLGVAPVVLLVIAGINLFVFRFFYAGEFGFKQAFSIVTHTLLAMGLVTRPLILIVMFMKGDWTLNPEEVLQANPTLFFERESTARWLWTLLAGFDVFGLWLIFLLAVGFGVASKRATGSAIWGILIPSAIVLAVKVGFALM